MYDYLSMVGLKLIYGSKRGLCWCHMIIDVSQNVVNTGSGNDLLSDGTKPLPESMLT